MRLRRYRAMAAAVAALALVAVSPAPSHADTGTISCEYRLITWTGGFLADIFIHNGTTAPVNGWTVRWTFDDPTVVHGVWGGDLRQENSVATGTPMEWNRVIQPGRVVMFGWSATAAQTRVPDDLTLNGVPC